jgi:hypothetical protein
MCAERPTLCQLLRVELAEVLEFLLLLLLHGLQEPCLQTLLKADRQDMRLNCCEPPTDTEALRLSCCWVLL